MQHIHYHLRSAPIAIAAMLALGTTPSLAQTAPTPSAPALPADPIVLQLPVDTPAAPIVTAPAPEPTSQPRIVLDVPPAEQAEPVTPTRTQGEQPAPVTVAERSSEAGEVAAPAREADNEPAAETSAISGSGDMSERSAPPAQTAPMASTEVAPPAIAAPVPAAEVAATERAPAAEPDWVAIMALALVGIIPLSLAFLALAWFRRRSRRTDGLQAEVAEVAETPSTGPAPIADPAAETDPDMLPARSATEGRPGAPREAVSVPASAARGNPLDGYRGLPSQGASVSLPAELPETFEERDALLKKMIAAKPDRANPFHSTRARAKRARLILQSLGRKFENVKPRIDLSEYTANWPALARKRTAYA